ncbi:MAG: head-tail adaptor protein [Gemmatales bacterium]|nr:head-tail adaptor protein [Gemmatales bacterium]MDW8175129.1 head-tail adaptor protein [Gemmatales bacterium]
MRPGFPGRLNHPMRIEVDQSTDPGPSGSHQSNWVTVVPMVFVALETATATEQMLSQKEAAVVSARITMRKLPSTIPLPAGRTRMVSLADGRVWYVPGIPPEERDGYVTFHATELAT